MHDTKNLNNGYPVLRPQEEFFDGDGSEAQPFAVGSAVQLDHVRHHPDAYFAQVADIDMRCVLRPSVPEGWDPIGKTFLGEYNGNGYVIENLYIDRSDENDVGLFEVNRGIIENVRLLDAEVVGKGGVGCLAGVNEKEIYTSSCIGVISAFSNAGGLIGTSREAYEESCYARGEVATDDDWAGGLVGYKYLGDTAGCYAAVAVKSGTNKEGGLFAYNSGTAKRCFFDYDVAGTSFSHGGEGFNTAAMTYDYKGASVPDSSSAPYYEWDFDNVWDHDKTGEVNDYYPFLVYSK